MIVGLGLGGSGQDIDTTSPVVNYHWFSWGRSRLSLPSRSPYGSGTRCPHRNSAGEVCQHLSGTSLAKIELICMYAFIYVKKRMQHTVSLQWCRKQIRSGEAIGTLLKEMVVLTRLLSPQLHLSASPVVIKEYARNCTYFDSISNS